MLFCLQDGASGNCYLHALRDIEAGEELCIDYNHRSGVSLMASYGFTMGLERMRSSFKVPVPTEPFMRAYVVTVVVVVAIVVDPIGRWVAH